MSYNMYWKINKQHERNSLQSIRDYLNRSSTTSDLLLILRILINIHRIYSELYHSAQQMCFVSLEDITFAVPCLTIYCRYKVISVSHYATSLFLYCGQIKLTSQLITIKLHFYSIFRNITPRSSEQFIIFNVRSHHFSLDWKVLKVPSNLVAIS